MMDVGTAPDLDDLSGSISGVWAEGFGASTLFEYGRRMTVFEDEPYITGSPGNSNGDKMLTLSYYEDSPYSLHWSTAAARAARASRAPRRQA